MLFTVIIPTYNRNDLLKKCLDALALNIEKINQPFEVIITDDSHGNVAKELVAVYPWATWLAGAKKGPAANRNIAAKNAKGKWLVFTDDDCLPSENWLKTYADAFIANEFMVYEGLTKADRKQLRFDEEAPINLTGGKLWSCNFAISSSLFRTLNGFDETFPYAAMEDIDFYMRVSQKATIYFLPEACVVHPWRKAKPFGSFKKHIRSHKHFNKIHGNPKEIYNYRITRLKILIGYSFSGFKQLAKFHFKGYAYYIEHLYISLILIFV
ncbi:glycosyltransferase family 2 protein [Parasediminibacterium sp. JCM 36343]|uniref:glycosyltransferase family 2 protein n=1 Tax=Parasediminibacterium sp. JCM 36343 TaxID=3374279 RepID=UPI00397A3F00